MTFCLCYRKIDFASIDAHIHNNLRLHICSVWKNGKQPFKSIRCARCRIIHSLIFFFTLDVKQNFWRKAKQKIIISHYSGLVKLIEVGYLCTQARIHTLEKCSFANILLMKCPFSASACNKYRYSFSKWFLSTPLFRWKFLRSVQWMLDNMNLSNVTKNEIPGMICIS